MANAVQKRSRKPLHKAKQLEESLLSIFSYDHHRGRYSYSVLYKEEAASKLLP